MMKPCQTLQKECTQEKGEKKKQGVRTKVPKEPKRGRPHGGKGTTKYRNLQMGFLKLQ